MEFLTAEWGVDNEHFWLGSATSGGHDTLGLSSQRRSAGGPARQGEEEEEWELVNGFISNNCKSFPLPFVSPPPPENSCART